MQSRFDAHGRERAWSREEKRDASLTRWRALHPGEQVPSVVEVAERHRIEADADQAKMERGECCGRCSASGLCGSQRWGWLHIHYGSGRCPQFEYERGFDRWLRAILGDEYEQYGNVRSQEENRDDGCDHQGPAETARGAV